jgi:hypothetical protein
MSAFTRAFSNLVGMISSVQLQLELAKKHSNEVRAVILLDKMSDILKAKGLATSTRPTGSEDFRQAVLDLDPEYQACLEKVLTLKSVLALLEGKQQAFDKAYTATKKIYGDGAYRHSPDLSVNVHDNNSFFKPNKF